MVTGAGVGELASSRVLDALEFIREFGLCAIDNTVAVVNPGSAEGMDQGFCSR